MTMGTTRTLADGEAFVQGRSQDTAKALVQAAADADLKGTVKTTYDGYIAPVEVVKAAGLGDFSTESSTPENPADHSDAPPVKPESSDDKDVDPEVLAQLEAEKAAAAQEQADADADKADAEEDRGVQFDPTTATIADVKDYLDGSDDTERERVLAAEAASDKPRKGVLDLAVPSEGAK
jgi:hypothetical protein